MTPFTFDILVLPATLFTFVICVTAYFLLTLICCVELLLLLDGTVLLLYATALPLLLLLPANNLSQISMKLREDEESMLLERLLLETDELEADEFT